MAVIPFSQLELARTKRDVREALARRDWLHIQQADLLLSDRLQAASEDPHRNAAQLLCEVKNIVSLYRQLLDACRTEVEALENLTTAKPNSRIVKD